MDCIWCSNSKKRCKSCGVKVCPKHASAANGCCVPCLDAVQEAVRQGRCTDQAEEAEIEAVGGAEASTYGEVTPLGFRTMATRLGLGAADTFADLGSGLGRCVLQAASEFHVHRAIGVEMALSRHSLAEELLEGASSSAAAERVTFVHGDCADEAVWQDHLADVSAVYVSNLLFDDALNARLARRLEAAASVRAVASLRPFEGGNAALGGGFTEETPRDLLVETSWRAPEELQQAGTLAPSGSLVYVYRRPPAGAQQGDAALSSDDVKEG